MKVAILGMGAYGIALSKIFIRMKMMYQFGQNLEMNLIVLS